MNKLSTNLDELHTLADNVVVNWKSGSRTEADAFLAELVRRVSDTGEGDHIFWRAVAECGFVNVAFADRPTQVDGSEILSAVWERLTLEKIREFRGGSSVRTWLYRIAINVARDLERKERRHQLPQTIHKLRPRPTGQLEGSSLLSFCLDLEHARQSLEMDEVELLDLWLAHGDRSGAAIARQLGLQERTVRNRLNRLFEKLGVLLDDPQRNRAGSSA